MRIFDIFGNTASARGQEWLDRLQAHGDVGGQVGHRGRPMEDMAAQLKRCCVALAVLLFACADAPGPEQDAATTDTPAADAATQQASGSNDSELLDMLGTIRTGLARVVPEAERDRNEGLRVVQEIYSTGMEPLLNTYGETGNAFAGNALAAAITRLDADLQELIRLLESPDSDMSLIRDAVVAAERTVYDVETEGIAAGIGGD